MLAEDKESPSSHWEPTQKQSGPQAEKFIWPRHFVSWDIEETPPLEPLKCQTSEGKVGLLGVLEHDYQGGREQRIAYPYTEEGEFSRVRKRM